MEVFNEHGTDFSKAITDPSIVFTKPSDIVYCTFLSTEDKLIALKNWKSTLIHMSESTAEGMQGDEDLTMVLGEISNAIKDLEAE